MALPWSFTIIVVTGEYLLSLWLPSQLPCPLPYQRFGPPFVVCGGWTPRLPTWSLLLGWGWCEVLPGTTGNYLISFLVRLPIGWRGEGFLGPFLGRSLFPLACWLLSHFQSEIHEAKNRHIGYSLPCSLLESWAPYLTTFFPSSFSVLCLCYMQCPCFNCT